MNQINRIKIIIICLPLLIFVGVVIAFCENFYSINFNDTEASVIALLGKPDVIENCNDSLWWNLEY
jgi:hypothetical protein